MTLTNISRKRERSHEDYNDYIPVTKRMNNLHIDVVSDGANNLSDALNCYHMTGSDAINSIQTNNHCQQPHHRQCLGHSTGVNDGHIYVDNCVAYYCTTYSPELDLNSNPIYYESNRILFEAHLHRLQRMSNIRKS
ncbi:uncharacterized protein LOC128965609 [Oppia nitens]|uniref:uncharacterized protein LOC128965609 n=1 Tax=Oppia nitens TaxID=1686743 RepID=UPI0023D9BD0D|nr:uncharacterized protein LOC128965609 [Oppia nitens]